MKKILRTICICLTVCALSAFFSACNEKDQSDTDPQQTQDVTEESEIQGQDDQKTFTASGMSIRLTKNFQAQSTEGYTASYVNEKDTAMVFVLQEKFSLMEGFEDWTIDAYAAAVKKSAPNADSITVKKENNITCFEYQFTNPDLNTEYYYYTTVFKDSDCFWTIQFSCLAKDRAEMKPLFTEYAKSVTFGA